ncbi:MAG: leucine-rich repeat domain-containing protein [Planctomycetota bacterium]|nr:leucine-rich repeat domain-containing protein [Planctomycetota bacterium]
MGWSPKSQRFLVIVVYLLPVLWIADHAWQREQVSAGQQAFKREISERKAAEQQQGPGAECKRLEILYLSDTLITDQSIPFLAQMTQLKELSLRSSISSEAEGQLSESLPDCSVYVKR